MGKSKEATEEVEVEVEVQVCAIAKPLANEKLSKKVLSVIKKGKQT
jgi:hypothetical protein